MANATVSRLGQVNLAGDDKALFLKKFAGEVITAFHSENVTLSRHMIRTIENGKSAQFPVLGRVSASYHTPGAEITGGQVAHAEQVITIDDLLIAPVFIANIDEAMNHYDVRQPYTMEAGTALAEQWDKNVLQVGVLAARASAPITGEPGGTRIVNANYGTVGTDLASGIFKAAQQLDENKVPGGDRSLFVLPAQYYLLAQNTDVINRDWGGAGAYADGTVLRIANIEVVKTTNLPNSNITTGPTKYQGDFSTTVGIVMNKMAVGTVKLLDMAIESEYDIRRQGTLIVAKYAIGHGIVNPACAIELATL